MELAFSNDEKMHIHLASTHYFREMMTRKLQNMHHTITNKTATILLFLIHPRVIFTACMKDTAFVLHNGLKLVK